jgi:hypothetical protein
MLASRRGNLLQPQESKARLHRKNPRLDSSIENAFRISRSSSWPSAMQKNGQFLDVEISQQSVQGFPIVLIANLQL